MHAGVLRTDDDVAHLRRFVERGEVAGARAVHVEAEAPLPHEEHAAPRVSPRHEAGEVAVGVRVPAVGLGQPQAQGQAPDQQEHRPPPAPPRGARPLQAGAEQQDEGRERRQEVARRAEGEQQYPPQASDEPYTEECAIPPAAIVGIVPSRRRIVASPEERQARQGEAQRHEEAQGQELLPGVDTELEDPQRVRQAEPARDRGSGQGHEGRSPPSAEQGPGRERDMEPAERREVGDPPPREAEPGEGLPLVEAEVVACRRQQVELAVMPEVLDHPGGEDQAEAKSRPQERPEAPAVEPHIEGREGPPQERDVTRQESEAGQGPRESLRRGPVLVHAANEDGDRGQEKAGHGHVRGEGERGEERHRGNHEEGEGQGRRLREAPRQDEHRSVREEGKGEEGEVEGGFPHPARRSEEQGQRVRHQRRVWHALEGVGLRPQSPEQPMVDVLEPRDAAERIGGVAAHALRDLDVVHLVDVEGPGEEGQRGQQRQQQQERDVCGEAALGHGCRRQCYDASPRAQSPGRLNGARGVSTTEPAAFSATPSGASADGTKAVIAGLYRTALADFLASGARIRFPEASEPLVSVLLVLCNRAELTLRCLRSIAEFREAELEVIVVDNASNDETPALLRSLEGVRVIRNRANRGFTLAVNQAARRARGLYLLLLNNDAELLPGALSSALSAVRSAPDVGAVGGRIVLLDGTLQEAGSLVWSDGSCLGYGRGEPPLHPAAMFRRDVDYCSGAFLLTPRELFLGEGGFDEAFSPAYYEEVDYCLRLWEKGYRVVYEPRATILHFEFASSGSTSGALRLQAAHRETFVGKHGRTLRQHHPPAREHVLEARQRAPRGRRVLILDDRVPHEALGAGFPRALRMIRVLVDLGHAVTLYPLSVPDEDWGQAYAEVPREVEIMLGHGEPRLGRFLAERAGYYDALVVSRPHNLARLAPHLPPRGRRPAILYDAEAVFARREIGRRRLAGEEVSPAEERAAVEEELALSSEADAVLGVSESECEAFRQGGSRAVFRVGHALEARPTPAPFDERRGFLFVGAAHQDGDPNVDAVSWLVTEILPLVREALGEDVPLLVAGALRSSRVLALAGPQVVLLGDLERLDAVYDRARVFVAPTRYAAGLPHKVHQAAAAGLPTVITPLLAQQTGWRTEEETLVGQDAREFARQCVRLHQEASLWTRLREKALLAVARDCSPLAFRAGLEDALRHALDGRPRAVRQP